MTRYPRFTPPRTGLKLATKGLDRGYLRELRRALRAEWESNESAIVAMLRVNQKAYSESEWILALVEAVYDVETGAVSRSDESLPRLSWLYDYSEERDQSGQRLYTALSIILWWTKGRSAESTELALTEDAVQADLSTRRVLDILKDFEPDREPQRESAGAAGTQDDGDDAPAEPDDGKDTAVDPTINPESQLADVLSNKFTFHERTTLIRELGDNAGKIEVYSTDDQHSWDVVSYYRRQDRLAELWEAVRKRRPRAGLRPPNPFLAKRSTASPSQAATAAGESSKKGRAF